MRIKRANFRFNRLVNVDDIIGHSNLLLMEQEDINVDNNVHDCILRIICSNFSVIAISKIKEKTVNVPSSFVVNCFLHSHLSSFFPCSPSLLSSTGIVLQRVHRKHR